jgi:hypothetical protein
MIGFSISTAMALRESRAIRRHLEEIERLERIHRGGPDAQS